MNVILTPVQMTVRVRKGLRVRSAASVPQGLLEQHVIVSTAFFTYIVLREFSAKDLYSPS